MNKCPHVKTWFLHVINNSIGFAKFVVNRFACIAAVGLLATAITTQTYAQSNAEGYIYGTVSGASSVSAVNTGTGQTRTSTVSADGTFNIPSLPTGVYNVVAKKGAAVVQTHEGVSVNLGSGTAVRFGAADGTLQLEKFVVSSSTALSQIDTSQTGASLQIRKEMVDILPVARNLAAVMQLAPGVSKGDAAFGSSPSFAGASVAENNVYINGFNVTNFRNGLGFSEVPFDFYENFQILVGGYGPEYGRSTGGVTNVTTKSGSNKYEAGFNVYYLAPSLRTASPNTYLPDGSIYNARQLTKRTDSQANIYAGFPIIKNHLFFYGIYNVKDYTGQFTNVGANVLYKDKNKNPFWGYKVDYVINDNHRIEYTAFSDRNDLFETGYAYDYATRTVGVSQGQSTYFNGGKNDILRYSGTFGENFQLSALYGKGGYNLTIAGAGDSSPAIYDGRSGTLVPLGTWTTLQPTTSSDQRKAYRIDAVWKAGSLGVLGKHTLKAGGDYEDNLSKSNTFYSGHIYYRYYKPNSAGKVSGVVVPTPNVGAVRVRHYEVGGSFKVQNTAYYVEDDVSLMNDKLKLSLGLRNEGFKNFNKDDKIFIVAKNQWAPRISVSYDPAGDGKAKLYANWGLYYLPIASNTNVRASGGELFTEQYFQLLSVNADGTPVIGSAFKPLNVFSNGVAPDARTVAAIGLNPMFQSEFIAGAQFRVLNHWTVGVRFTGRDLKSTIDDTEVEPAITRWAARTGKPEFSPDATYVLFNPGKDLTFLADVAGNGTYAPVTLTKDDLQMPDAIRKYYSITLEAERDFINNWMMRVSYTWAQNYGNFEGWVKSENEQTDAGITGAFDYPEFMVNTYGRLPNDRRHQFKFQSAYRPTSELTLGATALVQSGRPLNKLGSPLTIAGYDSLIFEVPRGTFNTTPWIYNIDLAATYVPKAFKKKLSLSVDILNVFNFQNEEKRNETYTDAAQYQLPSFNLIRSYQPPRAIQLSVRYDY